MYVVHNKIMRNLQLHHLIVGQPNVVSFAIKLYANIYFCCKINMYLQYILIDNCEGLTVNVRIVILLLTVFNTILFVKLSVIIIIIWYEYCMCHNIHIIIYFTFSTSSYTFIYFYIFSSSQRASTMYHHCIFQRYKQYGGRIYIFAYIIWK